MSMDKLLQFVSERVDSYRYWIIIENSWSIDHMEFKPSQLNYIITNEVEYTHFKWSIIYLLRKFVPICLGHSGTSLFSGPPNTQ